MKHEWRKKERQYYLPKNTPEYLTLPSFQFLTIDGEGSPESPEFQDYIGALYSVSYAIKMTLKKHNSLENYSDYTVYPLEGIWDLNEDAKKNFTGKINKEDFVFSLMIRQPDFVTSDFASEMIELTKKKKPHPFLDKLKIENIEDGSSIQMLHIGSFDNESESFNKMERFAEENHFKRLSKQHREIYLSDFRKIPKEKLKTVLRFKVS